MTCVRRLHVTLIEILLVMALIAVVAGIGGLSINRLIREQRFRNEVSLVMDSLRLAQNLMLILDNNVRVKFAEDKENGGIRHWIQTDCNLDEHWKKEILRKRENLQEIHFVEFKSEEIQNNTREGELDLNFLSGGTVMSRGILRLSNAESGDIPGAVERFVCLYGYPHPIVSAAERPDEKSCPSKAESDFDERLTIQTRMEVAERVLKNEAQ